MVLIFLSSLRRKKEKEKGKEIKKINRIARERERERERGRREGTITKIPKQTTSEESDLQVERRKTGEKQLPGKRNDSC